MSKDLSELFGAFATANQELAIDVEQPVLPPGRQPEVRISALDLLLEKLPADEGVKLTRLVREVGWDDNDPILIFQTFGKFRADAMAAKIDAAALQLIQAKEEILSAEVGLTKYREQLRRLTDETKTATLEADAYHNAISELRNSGSSVLNREIRRTISKTACLTSALVLGGDLLIRLLFS